ncbi:MAG: glycosyltransferase family 2 protein [Bacteroidaceae bacterium]|nr:glycosyltransferase family 2 protein [Bacteroidaceae bacterium]
MMLSVVIVSYNVRPYLAQCLDSVRRAIEGMEADVWVVDNASTDDTVVHLRSHYPWVHLIANADNRGFACANNQAIRQSKGRYVLLLNPDTVVGEDVLRGCVDFLEAHPEAGAAAVRMTNSDGTFARESRRGLPTPATSFFKMSGLCAAFPHHRVLGRYYLGHLDETQANPIEVMSGAYCMLRRTALEQVGLLDEDFFMYGEDIDLSYRLLQGGWQNWYLPLRILHYKGESTQKTSYRYVQIFYNAMLVFFDKHFAQRYRFSAFLIRLAVRMRAALGYAVRAVRKLWRRVAPALHMAQADTDSVAEPETALFFGSDASWQALGPVAAAAGLRIGRADTDAKADTEAHTHGARTIGSTGIPPTYMIFDPSVFSYQHILAQLAAQPAGRKRSFIGFFSAEHPVLLLPNDVFE